MSILCLTGWQQPADALACIAENAVHAPYEDYSDVPSFFASLPRKTDLAIGWSLGGQLLVRAIAGGHIAANQLLLLGAPFQFLAGETAIGMPREMWSGVVEGYMQDAPAMLRQFSGIISAGDAHAPRIARTLSRNLSLWKHGLFWLEELGRFSCETLDFSAFPPVTLVHGENDKVVYPAQAQRFKEKMPQAELILLERCAHAPHLHDTARLTALVKRHV